MKTPSKTLLPLPLSSALGPRFPVVRSFRVSPTSPRLLSFAPGYPYSSVSVVASCRMPHSRRMPRMLSAHVCTAAFSCSLSFCRTVQYTPSRPRTHGTDMYTSLSVPWEQLCEHDFLSSSRIVSVTSMHRQLGAPPSAKLTKQASAFHGETIVDTYF